MIIEKINNNINCGSFFKYRIIIRDELIFQKKNKKGIWKNKTIYENNKTHHKYSLINNYEPFPFHISYGHDFKKANKKIKKKLFHNIYIFFRLYFKKGFTFINIDNIYYFNFTDNHKDKKFVDDYCTSLREMYEW